MKAMLYKQGREEPVAVLDDVTIVTMNDNHKNNPVRLAYKTKMLNVTKVMVEMHRDEKMAMKLEDGRQGDVILQHSSLDMQGNAVGVLRLLGDLQE